MSGKKLTARSLCVRVQAGYCLEGWMVQPWNDNRTCYHLHPKVTVVLPDGGINEGKTYEADLECKDGGWIGVSYNGGARYVRTFEPKDWVEVDLTLSEAADLVARMRENAPDE